jgi:dipeptidase
MCDTMVVLPNSTADGSLIFAKNSDREPNEAHHLLAVPAADHAPGEMVQCTYIRIPQAPHTHAVLLAKPFWIWGAEMGANQHGVVIGNEAVFTKLPYEKTPGLIGMDFLRLALERAASASDALQVITRLLEKHGQSGNCGFHHQLYYHNSFLIADPREAWILETAGRQWAARQVKDVGSISNAITIGRDWDLASADLVNLAVDRGWCRQRDQFDFGKCYSDFLYTTFSAAASRQSCTSDALRAARGQLGVSDLIGILRSHRASSPTWSPAPAVTGADVCMHAGWGPVRGSQSTGSLVSHLAPDLHTHWATASSAPCTAIFKPVWIDAGLPELGPTPTGEYNPDCLWWQHERLHRAVLRGYPERLAAYQGQRDRLEAEFIAAAGQMEPGQVAARASFSAHCFEQAGQAEVGWLQQVNAVPPRPLPFYYNLAWQGFDRQAKLTS